MDNIIEITNVTYSYETGPENKKNEVLHGIDLSVKNGEFLAVIGHNGSGKSTLAKHLNGILLPSGGEVLVDGLNTKDEEKLLKIRQRIGMVFQNPDNQIVATVVEEDVAFGPENLGVEPAEIRRRVDEALKAVDLYEYREHAPHKLSGGQKQRLAIAGIIAMKPKCIVLDEPTAMLDPVGRKEVLSTIRKLNKEEGITIVLITHYMNEAAMADRVVVMDKGNIRLEGTPSEVFTQIETLRSIGLEAPQVTRFAHRLREFGFPADCNPISVTECVDAVSRFLESRA